VYLNVTRNIDSADFNHLQQCSAKYIKAQHNSIYNKHLSALYFIIVQRSASYFNHDTCSENPCVKGRSAEQQAKLATRLSSILIGGTKGPILIECRAFLCLSLKIDSCSILYRVVPQPRRGEERSRKIGGIKKDLGLRSKVFFVAVTEERNVIRFYTVRTAAP
jgi:hypothetical protein